MKQDTDSYKIPSEINTILIIDDDEFNRAILNLNYSRLCHECG